MRSDHRSAPCRTRRQCLDAATERKALNATAKRLVLPKAEMKALRVEAPA
jgi:hypothetical protein